MEKEVFLHNWHIQKKAKMVPFAGSLLPLQYTGIIEEHNATRNAVGMFDVSHMGEFFITGKDALANLEYLLANSISKLTQGKVAYSPVLYENGSFVDDITAYCFDAEKYMLCVNAANITKDAEWIQSNIKGDCQFTNVSDSFGQIALQGPKSSLVIKEIFEDALSLDYYSFYETSFNEENCIIARMGYTGEEGFELFVPPSQMLNLWEKLYQIGAQYNLLPVGLAARDILRLEATFPLYGNDIDDSHTPLEAMLKRFVSFDKDFIGKQALETQKEQGVKRKFIRFIMEGKAIPRQHYLINQGDTTIGEVTSGGYSPLLQGGIGMGYIQANTAKIGDVVTIIIRGKAVTAKIIKGSFLAYFKQLTT